MTLNVYEIGEYLKEIQRLILRGDNGKINIKYSKSEFTIYS